MTLEKRSCFVIMPFSKTTENHTEEYWTEHFEIFLKPLIEENEELVAHRSDELRGNIINQIINDLVTSVLVVADLTDKNPNVYWELGVRQSFRHGTITIAEHGTQLPFDIFSKATIFYHPDHSNDVNFCGRFKSAIRDCLKNPDRPDSHVLESLSGRGTMFEIFRRDEAIRRLDGLLEECGWNNNCIAHCHNQALHNRSKKFKLKKEFSIPFMKLASLELLISTRYIDADEKFYSSANEYWMLIRGMNENIHSWQGGNATYIEKKFIQLADSTKKICNSFKQTVEKTRKELAEKY